MKMQEKIAVKHNGNWVDVKPTVIVDINNNHAKIDFVSKFNPLANCMVDMSLIELVDLRLQLASAITKLSQK